MLRVSREDAERWDKDLLERLFEVELRKRWERSGEEGALYINTGMRLGTCLLLGLVMNKSRAMTQFALLFSIRDPMQSGWGESSGGREGAAALRGGAAVRRAVAQFIGLRHRC